MTARPALFVLGDSISINYGPALERSLAGRFRYDRKGAALGASQNIESALVNGGDSGSVLAFLRSQAGLFGTDEASILLLNCGLHDLRVDPESGSHQVEAETYVRNLEQIVTLAKSAAERVVWVCDHVHFLPAVSQMQGAYLAGWLEAFVYA